MTDEQQEREWTSEDRAKRAIVLQMLRNDHPERWTRAELERELPDVPPEAVEVAIEDLKAEGVLSFDGEQVWASLCARTLDALELIAI
jgi:hypothetical protein